jgi:hypothetical protein
MWINIIEPDRSQIEIWRMRIACLLPHASTKTHLKYVILIAFPLLQYLHESPTMLRYTYFEFIVIFQCVYLHAHANVMLEFNLQIFRVTF